MALTPRLALKAAHTWIGLAGALFVAALAVTGLYLNHPGAVKGADREVLCVAADPSAPGRLYRGTASSLDVSEDGGAAWEEVPMAYPPLDAVAVAFQPGNPRRRAVLQRWLGPLLSEDGGTVWEPVDLPFDPLAAGVELLSLSFDAKGAIYMETSQGLLTRAPSGEWRGIDFDLSRRNWKRLVKTLHNGHFFGAWFVKVYDAAAASLLLLIVTGVVLWRVKSS